MSSLLTHSLLDSKVAAQASSAEGDITSGAVSRASDPAVVVHGGRRRRKSSKKSKKAKKSKARKSNKKRRSSRSYRRPLFLL